MRTLIYLAISVVCAFAHAAEPAAVLGENEGLSALTKDRKAACKRIIGSSEHDEVTELIERGGEVLLPVRPKFIILEFKYKVNILYCYSAKAGKFERFMPIKLVYFTNYKEYGRYDPLKGLDILF